MPSSQQNDHSEQDLEMVVTQPENREQTLQLTSPKTCKQKHTYHTQATATRAKKRRNKAAGYEYLSTYQCNVCQLWHVTTQRQIINPQKEVK